MQDRVQHYSQDASITSGNTYKKLVVHGGLDRTVLGEVLHDVDGLGELGFRHDERLMIRRAGWRW